MPVRALGLRGDPCSAAAAEALYWETPALCAARDRALAALEDGRGVWLRGGPGSGRRTLLWRLAAQLAARGTPVLCPSADLDAVPASAAELLAALLPVAEGPGDDSPPAPTIRAAALRLYPALLDAFCTGGAVAVVLPWPDLSGELVVEAQLLAQLRVAGCAVCLPLLTGEGAAAVAGVEEVAVPTWSPADLGALVRHRMEGWGEPPPPALLAAAQGAGTPARALAAVRVHLLQRLFRPSAAGPDPAAGGQSVLDPEQVGEVDRLLRALDPGASPP